LHDSPGRQLRVARETAGLGLGQVASELHLSTHTIAALEDDHYDGLPSEVFILGYMRAYSRLLGLDPMPLLKGYRRLQPEGARSPALPVDKRQEDTRQPLLMPVLGVILVIALAGAGWLWWTQLGGRDVFANLSIAPDAGEEANLPLMRKAPQPVLPRRPDAAAPVTTPDAAQPSGEEGDWPSMEAEDTGDANTSETMPEADSPVESPAGTPASAPQGDERSPATTPATTGGGLIAALSPDANANEMTTEEPADQDTDQDSDQIRGSAEASEVIMSFTGPCWVDVRDATGEFKLFGEMNKGDRKQLGGRPPYSIILGNAAAVELTVAGKPFDVEGVARGNVARFDLDPASL
jgi:cytoskeleton protein RodZ